MDLVEVRRTMMGVIAQMAQKGTPLSAFFEVVERFTPAEDLVTYSFKHTGAGRYIFCEEPILTAQKAINDEYPTYSLYSGSGVIYQSSSGVLSARSEISLVKSSRAYAPVDYWGSKFTLDGDYLIIGTASGNDSIISFQQGKTYVVLKMKI